MYGKCAGCLHCILHAYTNCLPPTTPPQVYPACIHRLSASNYTTTSIPCIHTPTVCLQLHHHKYTLHTYTNCLPPTTPPQVYPACIHRLSASNYTTTSIPCIHTPTVCLQLHHHKYTLHTYTDCLPPTTPPQVYPAYIHQLSASNYTTTSIPCIHTPTVCLQLHHHKYTLHTYTNCLPPTTPPQVYPAYIHRLSASNYTTTSIPCMHTPTVCLQLHHHKYTDLHTYPAYIHTYTSLATKCYTHQPNVT